MAERALLQVQAQEGDESAVIEAEQQKSVQAAATLEQQQLARASGDRAAEEEHDTKRSVSLLCFHRD